ncbi:RusA family crossover junction endodeoxyribonuclease [Anaerosporobacter faecicola]|uniref:RusA family crossover junction endodeoxyribonuclease n=1 Tax=Anaerosporobacter faecicola TaxID=2718714 RepID=UPI00143C8226|nr:RusA family crossover junction endodeoxyribonuclease [Anaerosporobacter faecicola]
MTIDFTIPGNPQGKARARTFYNTRVKHMSSITPEKTVLYENLIKTRCLEALEHQTLPFTIFEGPLDVTIKCFFAPPKSTSKKVRKKMLDSEILPTKKPDIDNICKVVLDALNGIAYKDDTQVVQLQMEKLYNDEPYVRVWISEM